MATLQISSLHNANIYLDGVNLLGRASEIEVPQPKRLMQEYRGTGMAARIKIPVGYDQLEATIKWSSFDPIILLESTASNYLQVISVLGDVRLISAAGLLQETPAIFNMTGLVEDPGHVMLKAQENTVFTSKVTIWHCELFLSGVPIYLFDAMSNLFFVGGIDQLAQYRANIGG